MQNPKLTLRRMEKQMDFHLEKRKHSQRQKDWLTLRRRQTLRQRVTETPKQKRKDLEIVKVMKTLMMRVKY